MKKLCALLLLLLSCNMRAAVTALDCFPMELTNDGTSLQGVYCWVDSDDVGRFYVEVPVSKLKIRVNADGTLPAPDAASLKTAMTATVAAVYAQRQLDKPQEDLQKTKQDASKAAVTQAVSGIAQTPKTGTQTIQAAPAK